MLVELFGGDGAVCRGAMVAADDGQRLAALPAVYVARKLCDDQSCSRGAVAAHEVLGARRLIDYLIADGFDFRVAPSSEAVR